MFDLTAFLYGLGSILAAAFIVWAISVLKRDVSIVDSLWSLLFFIAAGVYLGTAPAPGLPSILVLVMVGLWALRLAAYMQQKRLLNTRTGELIAVEIQPLGESLREVGNRTLSVEGFRILAEPQNIDIQVFYHRADGRWGALESVLDGGRMLRYVAAANDRLASVESDSEHPLIRRGSCEL